MHACVAVIFLGMVFRGVLDASAQEVPASSRSALLGGFSSPGEWRFGETTAPVSIVAEGGVQALGEGIVVASKQVRIRYREFTVEADRALLDWNIPEVRAEGNVSFRGPDGEIRAVAVRYDFRLQEGVVYGVEGNHKDIHFRSATDENERGPSFQRISENQALLRGASFSGCEFPVPHYYLRGSEVIIWLNERIFVRDAVLYVADIPVLYLPAYTRSLRDPSPWSFELGYAQRLGAYGRMGYDYRHEFKEPEYLRPSTYRTRSRGDARVDVDYFTRRGVGLGLTYRYSLDFGRHKGNLLAYGIRDETRDVLDEESPPNRFAVQWKHRSQLDDAWLFQMDLDYPSDPDLYFDVLDHFEDKRLGRRPERRLRWAVTYAREQYLARLSADMRDRLGRNYYRDLTQPASDNLDYDPDPEGTGYNSDGVSKQRYGAASRKLPQFDFSSAHVKIWELPFYYDTQFHAFHALDKGHNPLSEDDDRWVDGADWSHSILHRLRLSERYTWTNRIGGGAAFFQRSDDRLGAKLPSGITYPYSLDGLTLVDRDTWLTGRRERSFRDVEEALAYVDYESKFHARFTDTLEGYLKYTYRTTTGDSLGEFYRSIGQRTAQTDIYQFPVRQHWIEGFLNYFLLYPNLSTYARAGLNLDRNANIVAYDLLNYAGFGGSYKNDTREFSLSAGVDIQERQIRDLSDPNAFEQSSMVYSGTMHYAPRHQRWWARLSVFAIQTLDRDPVDVPARERDRLDENQTEVAISPTVGTRVGPKYTAELASTYNTKYDDWQSAHLILKRDLHDAEAAIMTGFRTVEEIRNDRVEKDKETEVRFSIRLKTPGQARQLGVGGVQTLMDRQMQGEFAD